MQSALGVQSRGPEWVVHREAPLEWRKVAGVGRDAWDLWASAAREGERELLPCWDVGAVGPS